ncbi:phospholipase D-like domain-containing protein [Paenibacillus lentus]|uniref:phospholipase D-like domain-containing protein n=1 Tax=Paenibacillus lentus TaxID=1338368 RepID=UPI00365FFF75
MQRELDTIYKKIIDNYKKVSDKELTRLVELVNSRFSGHDIILSSLSQRQIFQIFDHITRATYELTKPGYSRSKHYILSNLCKARYAFESGSRKDIFKKHSMLIEDEFECMNCYVSFKFFYDGENPILLFKHNYGFGSITNWVEEFVKHINEKYLEDIGVEVIKDSVSIYYREAVIENVPISYDKVEFTNEIKNPIWKSVEEEWFEDLWNQHCLVESYEDNSIFFEGNTSYTANKKLREILLLSKKNISIIDPYVDSSLLNLLEIVDRNVHIRVVSDVLQGDFEDVYKLFKKERGKIDVIVHKKKIHDRFIIIDDRHYYLLGSSINSFGDKATTLIQIKEPKLKEDIQNFFKNMWSGKESL